MVHRDIELSRLTGARPPAAPVDRAERRAGPGGQGRRSAGHRRGGAAPLHADRRAAARLRLGVQGQPAAADRRRHRRDQGRASPTARSTPSPPTTRPTRPRPRSTRSTRRRPACSVSRPRWRWRSPSSTCRSPTSSPRCPGSRRRSPGSPTGTAARSPPASRQPGRVRPGRAGRSSGGARQQEPQHALRRRRCAARCATRCSTAARSSSTERRSDEWRDTE